MPDEIDLTDDENKALDTVNDKGILDKNHVDAINNYVKTGKTGPNLHSAIAASPASGTTQLFYRVVPTDPKYETGETVITNEPLTAGNNVNAAGSKSSVVLEIGVGANQRGVLIGYNPKLHEAVFAPKTKLKVLGKKPLSYTTPNGVVSRLTYQLGYIGIAGK